MIPRSRYLGRDEVKAAFAKGVPMVEVGDYKIHASRREGPGMAEIHTRDTDIAYVLQGSATLVTGGTPSDLKSIGPEELRGSGIRAARLASSSRATSSSSPTASRTGSGSEAPRSSITWSRCARPSGRSPMETTR